MSDLSSRILEAIAQREQLEQAKTAISDEVDCERCGGDRTEVQGIAEMDGEVYVATLSCGHEIYSGDLPRVSAPNAEAVRFCAAHREIVESSIEAHRFIRDGGVDRQLAKAANIDSDTWEAMEGEASAWSTAVDILARAYNVEEG